MNAFTTAVLFEKKRLLSIADTVGFNLDCMCLFKGIRLLPIAQFVDIKFASKPVEVFRLFAVPTPDDPTGGILCPVSRCAKSVHSRFAINIDLLSGHI